MTTSQFADAAAVPVDTVRYYERRGLLPEPPRGASGHRTYRTQDLARLQAILRAKTLGFTLTDIKALLALADNPDADAGPVKHTASKRLKAVEEQLAELAKQRDALARLVEACDGNAMHRDDCPVLETILDSETPSGEAASASETQAESD